MKRTTAGLLATSALAAVILPNISVGRSHKPEKKCLLKDCNKMTTHNGGYCCAEHCKKDRATQQERE